MKTSIPPRLMLAALSDILSVLAAREAPLTSFDVREIRFALEKVERMLTDDERHTDVEEGWPGYSDEVARRARL